MSRRWSILGLMNALSLVLVGQALGWLPFPTNYEVIFVGPRAAGTASRSGMPRAIRVPDHPPSDPVPQPLDRFATLADVVARVRAQPRFLALHRTPLPVRDRRGHRRAAGAAVLRPRHRRTRRVDRPHRHDAGADAARRLRDLAPGESGCAGRGSCSSGRRSVRRSRRPALALTRDVAVAAAIAGHRRDLHGRREPRHLRPDDEHRAEGVRRHVHERRHERRLPRGHRRAAAGSGACRRSRARPGAARRGRRRRSSARCCSRSSAIRRAARALVRAGCCGLDAQSPTIRVGGVGHPERTANR